MARKLLLIDASSSIYRAFYALPALSNSRGVPTHATLGFTNMLLKALRELEPDYVAVVWDSKPKRRKELYPEYKANREAAPEDLSAQIPSIRKIVASYGLASLECEGEEADDVIATLTNKAAEAGLDVCILSTDRDLMQLVDKGVTLIDTMRDRHYGPSEVEARFGVPPDRMLDYRALTGDSSDNIPGVRGIGEKGAASLINEYGTLDNLLAHAAEIKSKRQREALTAGADAARLSLELSRLRSDLPVELDLDALAASPPDRAKLAEIFRELELKRLLEDLGGELAVSARAEDAGVSTSLVDDEASLRKLVSELEGSERLSLACLVEPEDAMRGELVGLALAADPGTAHYVALSPIGEASALEILRALLERASRIWIGGDLKRDAVALGRRGIELAGELRDVAVAAYVVDPAQQVRRPELLVRGLLGRELAAREDLFGKGARRTPADQVEPGRVAELLGRQVALELELERALSERLAATGQLELYDSIEVPLVGVLARMEQAGVRVDERRLADLSRDLEAQLASIEAHIYELAGEKFKINSPKQLQHILFEKLALPPSKRIKTGFSTDESVLAELALTYDLPGEILSYRRLAKLKSTYVDALPELVNPQTGRIHCSFNQTVAATGRLSASNPNLQNIPIRTPAGQRIREAFIPAEERLFFSADYSQIELRILAHLSNDEPLLEAFRTGQDIHVATASQVFGIAPEQVSSQQRDRMKGINFGIIYGSSAFGIAQQLGIAQSEAREHIRAYFERYPGIRAFLDRAAEQARVNGYAETLYGRRRYLPDLHSRNRVQRAAAERMAVNSVIQGTAADMIKRAMVEIDGGLRKRSLRARMILQVHDELVFEVSPADLEQLRGFVEAGMVGVADLKVPLEVHSAAGETWLEAH
jgi:DNA polymerase-1